MERTGIISLHLYVEHISTYSLGESPDFSSNTICLIPLADLAFLLPCILTSFTVELSPYSFFPSATCLASLLHLSMYPSITITF